jgi:hypothetical protein
MVRHARPNSGRCGNSICKSSRLRPTQAGNAIEQDEAGAHRHQERVQDMSSDEEVGRHILDIFMKHKIRPSGTLRRNYFMEVRDADFQRGLNKAVEYNWIKIKLRDRYTYELTESGFVAGSSERRLL